MNENYDVKSVLVGTILFVLYVLGISLPIVIAGEMEILFPLQGAAFVTGIEASVIISFKLAMVINAYFGKKALAELAKVYDAEAEGWDDIYPIIPPWKIKLTTRIFQFLPLVYGMPVSIFGIQLGLAIASTVIFLAMYRCIPSIIKRHVQVLALCQYIDQKLNWFRKQQGGLE
jgi:hypothetical protein